MEDKKYGKVPSYAKVESGHSSVNKSHLEH